MLLVLGLPNAWTQDLSNQIIQDSIQIHIPDANRYIFRLQNGIIGFAVADLNATAVQFSAHVGGGYADDRKPGSAEVLELLFHQGPCWMGPGSFERSMEKVGGSVAVRMGPETTEITLSASPEHARLALRIFAGTVREPCIRQAVVDSLRLGLAASAPRGGNLQWRDSFVPDASMQMAVDIFERQVFADHSYDQRVFAEDIAQLDFEGVRDFHQRIFVPRNTIVTVSGLFDPVELGPDLLQRFADWQPQKRHVVRKAKDVQRPDSVEILHFRTNVMQSFVVLGQDLPPVNTVNWPALHVMSYVLTRAHRLGDSVDALSVLKRRFRGPGTFTFRVSSPPGSADKFLSRARERIEQLRNEDVPEQEVSAAKEALITDVLRSKFASAHIIARTFAKEFSGTGSMAYMEAFPGLVARVTAEDVRRAANKFLDPRRMTAVIIEGGEPGG